MMYLKDRFKDSKFRLTKPREIIFDILEGSKEHLSVDEIYRKAYSIYPAIGLTTVYRTLELLVEMGIVNKYDFGDGRSRYELNYIENRKKDHHHHLVCKICHKVFDYTDFMDEENELIKKTIKSLEIKYNFHITDHFIEFSGYCNECYKKLKSKNKLYKHGVTKWK